MRTIKRYANGKLYDPEGKKYLSKTRLSDMIKTGEELKVVDVKTEEDVTAVILKEIMGQEENAAESKAPDNVLVGRLKKGQATVSEYGKKYISIWHNALSMAEDEMDKMIKRLVKDKKISPSEGKKLKQEIDGQTDGLKTWINQKIDQRVNDVLGIMNLATKAQVADLTEKIEALAIKIEGLAQPTESADEPQPPSQSEKPKKTRKKSTNAQ